MIDRKGRTRKQTKKVEQEQNKSPNESPIAESQSQSPNFEILQRNIKKENNTETREEENVTEERNVDEHDGYIGNEISKSYEKQEHYANTKKN